MPHRKETKRTDTSSRRVRKSMDIFVRASGRIKILSSELKCYRDYEMVVSEQTLLLNDHLKQKYYGN